MNLKTTSFNKTPLILAMMIIATGQVGVSIYLPSLPLMSESLGVDSTQIQLVVTLFLIGFGGSQLFYGPLSDAIGRRPVFLLGQSVYLFGTVLCFIFTDSFTALITGRLLQGLGAGSASVLSRSVLRDSYDGPNLTKALSYMSVTASILPIIAPVFGGWIAHHLGWQSVFSFVLVYLIAIFTIGWRVLPETLPYSPSKFEPRKIVGTYIKLLGNWQVIQSASYNWVTYLGAVVTLSLLPFLMQKQLGMSAADYGTIMLIPSFSLLIGTVCLNLMSKRLSQMQILFLSMLIISASGLGLLLAEFNTATLVIAFSGYAFAQGISFPISIAMLLAPHKKQVGSVSALSGSVQMILAGAAGGFLIEHWVSDQQSLGYYYLVSAIVMAAMSLVVPLKKRLKRTGLILSCDEN
ncbi:multidrug effflux MFS transporter [Vibrio astriarenae]|uniref:multidrug effflux MFS transporter n=1 Tax=Vibrio astriarenae TaxID=1481923 RepID=UPI0037358CC1